MHNSSILRMQWFVNQYIPKPSNGKKLKVLDVGSYDVNGSYKHLFPESQFDYKGLDMAEGPNVDIYVENPYKWNELATDSFDIVISGQAFEHIEFFWLTLAEMARVLKKDGFMCIIAPNGFSEHRHPVDCYRFFTDGMVALARYVCLEPLHAHTNLAPSQEQKDWYSEYGADSMLVARKNYQGETQYVNVETYTCVPPDHKKMTAPMVPAPKVSVLKRGVKKAVGLVKLYIRK